MIIEKRELKIIIVDTVLEERITKDITTGEILEIKTVFRDGSIPIFYLGRSKR